LGSGVVVHCTVGEPLSFCDAEFDGLSVAEDVLDELLCGGLGRGTLKEAVPLW
jgi:hypothetical protein